MNKIIFNIATAEGKVEVAGYSIVLKGLKLCVHKQRFSPHFWSVSCYSTGYRIAEGHTIKAAIRNAGIVIQTHGSRRVQRIALTQPIINE